VRYSNRPPLHRRPAGPFERQLASPAGRGHQALPLSYTRTHRGQSPFIVGVEPLPGVLLDALTAQHTRRSPPGFLTHTDPSWTNLIATTSAPPPTSPTLVAAIATIQAAVAASQEQERATILALERERAMGVALTTQMAIVSHLLLSRSPTPPSLTPETPHTFG
jgi:hypothetical protein